MKNCCVPKKIFTSLIILWISYIFLVSLPYKFTKHEETQNIFGEIWKWMNWVFGEGIWNGFSNYGSYLIGSAELIVSTILLIPLFYYLTRLFGLLKDKKIPEYLIAIGWIWASFIMSWAIFFHLYTPLGIEVNGDGGSLFKSAVSIWILWIILFIVYFKNLKEKFKK